MEAAEGESRSILDLRGRKSRLTGTRICGNQGHQGHHAVKNTGGITSVDDHRGVFPDFQFIGFTGYAVDRHGSQSQEDGVGPGLFSFFGSYGTAGNSAQHGGGIPGFLFQTLLVEELRNIAEKYRFPRKPGGDGRGNHCWQRFHRHVVELPVVPEGGFRGGKGLVIVAVTVDLFRFRKWFKGIV